MAKEIRCQNCGCVIKTMESDKKLRETRDWYICINSLKDKKNHKILKGSVDYGYNLCKKCGAELNRQCDKCNTHLLVVRYV